MKRLLLLPALCLPLYLFAQGFGSFSHDQPYFAKDRTSSSNPFDTNIIYSIPNVYRWWVSSDVPTNHSISNQWTDRVVSSVLGQPDVTKQPTNSSLGVHFDKSGKYLTNTTLTQLVGPDMFLFVAQVDRTAGEYQYWWSGEDNNAGFYWVLPQVNDNGTWSSPAGNFGDIRFEGPIADDILFDFLWYDGDVYTNGVLNELNNPGASWSYPNLRVFGAKENGTLPANGYVREMVFWTNVPYGGSLSATTVSNLHYYVTNKYPTITP